MPANTGASPLARSRLVRFSRSSSLTRRVRKRSSEKILRRSSPSVRGRLLMKGTPTNKLSPIIRAVGTKRFARPGHAEDVTPKTQTLHHQRACPFPPAKIGKDAFQIGSDRLDALAFRSHR